MKHPKYDIYISYRRDGGVQYARMICLLFRNKGYRVFQDIDCLTDDTNFIEELKYALNNSKVYMVILSNNTLSSTYAVNGILKANELSKPIIPVVCDDKYPLGGIFSIPKSKDAYEILRNLQWSEMNFGVTLRPDFNYMEKRVRKYVKPNIIRHLHNKIKDDVIKYSSKLKLWIIKRHTK